MPTIHEFPLNYRNDVPTKFSRIKFATLYTTNTQWPLKSIERIIELIIHTFLYTKNLESCAWIYEFHKKRVYLVLGSFSSRISIQVLV